MSNGSRSLFRILHKYKKFAIVLLPILIVLYAITFVFTLHYLNYSKKADLNYQTIAHELEIKCRKGNTSQCYKNFLHQFAKDNLFLETKSLLEHLQMIDPQTKYCHTYAHTIAIAEVEKDPQNWTNVFNYVPSNECSYGYFHGVIEGKYISSPDFLIDPPLINKVCLKDIQKSGSQRSCSHAFGHLVLTQQSGSIEKALLMCDSVNEQIADACYQGVFMENIQKENLSYHGIAKRADWTRQYLIDQMNQCKTYIPNKLIECWRSLAPVILSVQGEDYAKINEICMQTPNQSAIKACRREAYGMILVNKFTQKKALTDPCTALAKIEGEYQECMIDLVNFSLLTSNKFKSDFQQSFCPSLISDEHKRFCQDKVNTFIFSI